MNGEPKNLMNAMPHAEEATVREAVAAGLLPGRLWLYSNYHCNLACSYCLTESGPGVPRREMPAAQMISAATEAAALGFTGLGVTGGEPFLLPHLPDTLAHMSELLPVIALSNGTVFGDHRRERLRQLADRRVTLQLSLDSADPAVNDRARGPGNFRAVVDAIPRLVELGVHVRIASTGDVADPSNPEATEAAARLCALHRSLGVPDDDHITRPVVSRGRGLDITGAVAADTDNLEPELTLTVDGAFWSPFGPTVRGGRLDTDLRVTETVSPLTVPALALLHIVEERRTGTDTTLGIR